MSDAIGVQRARVQLQSPMRVADEIGGVAISWSDEGEVWAAIEAIGAGQSADFDTAPAISSFRITLNNRADARTGWRAIWGGRVLRIVGVNNEGAPRIELLCEEERL